MNANTIQWHYDKISSGDSEIHCCAILDPSNSPALDGCAECVAFKLVHEIFKIGSPGCTPGCGVSHSVPVVGYYVTEGGSRFALCSKTGRFIRRHLSWVDGIEI